MPTPTVKVLSGDIAEASADALITAINSAGLWNGGIDKVIRSTNGSLFHEQARNTLLLRHGGTFVALGNNVHRSAFRNVVFVIDDLQGPLSDIIYNGLQAAAEAGFKVVTLPAIRTGFASGRMESVDEAISEIAEGVRRFVGKHPDTSLVTIKFIIYNDPVTQDKLKALLTTH